VRRVLATFDRLARQVAAGDRVITHGEPHPGNTIAADGRTMLIDWDTAGLAPPERDLWMITGDELPRYTAATGRVVDPEALSFYRLRWALDDTSSFIDRLRGARRRTADNEHAWHGLEYTITQLITRPERPQVGPAAAQA
jgi:spectinomycin phosphotransferase